jgi:hypothetical protein
VTARGVMRPSSIWYSVAVGPTTGDQRRALVPAPAQSFLLRWLAGSALEYHRDPSRLIGPITVEVVFRILGLQRQPLRGQRPAQ